MKHQQRVRFAEISDGDRFVAYVSRERVVDGYGMVIGQPFEDATPVWSKIDFYTQRCKGEVQLAILRELDSCTAPEPRALPGLR